MLNFFKFFLFFSCYSVFISIGALTAKPYSFLTRPWELRSVDSVDILDGLCSNIRVDVRGSNILRILPKQNSTLNGDWISDKIRFSFDGSLRQRLGAPQIKLSYLHFFIFNGLFTNFCSIFKPKIVSSFFSYKVLSDSFFNKIFEGNFINSLTFSKDSFFSFKFIEISWEFCSFLFVSFFARSFFRVNYYKTKPFLLRSYVGDSLDLESALFLRDFLVNSGFDLVNHSFKFSTFSNNTFRSEFFAVGKNSENFLLDIDCLLLLGCNLRFDAPLINSFVRKKLIDVESFSPLNSDFIFCFGQYVYLSYSYYHLGTTSRLLFNILEGSHFFCSVLLKASKPLIIYGSSFYNQQWAYPFFSTMWSLAEVLNKPYFFYNIFPLYKDATLSNILELGFSAPVSNEVSKVSILNYYLSKSYDFFSSPKKNAFVDFDFINLYQGAIALTNNNNDFFLPAVTFFEKNSFYINFYGYVQRTRFAVFPPLFAKTDWKIFLFMSFIFCKNFTSINSLFLLRRRLSFLTNTKLLLNLPLLGIFNPLFSKVIFSFTFFIIFDSLDFFYTSSSLTKASKIMSLCSKSFESVFMSNTYFDVENLCN